MVSEKTRLTEADPGEFSIFNARLLQMYVHSFIMYYALAYKGSKSGEGKYGEHLYNIIVSSQY